MAKKDKKGEARDEAAEAQEEYARQAAGKSELSSVGDPDQAPVPAPAGQQQRQEDAEAAEVTDPREPARTQEAQEA